MIAKRAVGKLAVVTFGSPEIRGYFRERSVFVPVTLN